jgi:hypothetical protein
LAKLEQELCYYVKLFVIMYANDTALLAKSASNLQNKVESVPSILHYGNFMN